MSVVEKEDFLELRAGCRDRVHVYSLVWRSASTFSNIAILYTTFAVQQPITLDFSSNLQQQCYNTWGGLLEPSGILVILHMTFRGNCRNTIMT